MRITVDIDPEAWGDVMEAFGDGAIGWDASDVEEAERGAIEPIRAALRAREAERDDPPESLRMARECRRSGSMPTPMTLLTAAARELGVDHSSRAAEQRYVHALEEAGAIVDSDTEQPIDPCTYCGWSPSAP